MSVVHFYQYSTGHTHHNCNLVEIILELLSLIYEQKIKNLNFFVTWGMERSQARQNDPIKARGEPKRAIQYFALM